jgi:Aldehyde dehydrogenase family/Hydantoinase/oxoprolinase N-terminal region
MEFYASSDIGGTFTDTAVIDGRGRLKRYKSSTVPNDPVKGILATMELAAADNGLVLNEFMSRVGLFSPGQVFGAIAAGDAADIDAAVKAARFALEEGHWGRLTATERGRLLSRLGRLIDDNAEELALLEAEDTG